MSFNPQHGSGCSCWQCAGAKDKERADEDADRAARQRMYENGDPNWNKQRP